PRLPRRTRPLDPAPRALGRPPPPAAQQVLGGRALRRDRGGPHRPRGRGVLEVLGREDRGRHGERRRLRVRGALGGAAPLPERVRRHLRVVLRGRGAGDPAPPREARTVTEFPWLTWLIFFPLAGAALIVLL